MKCIICSGNSEFFLIKRSFKQEYREMTREFSFFEYYKCNNCGFTISKTHIEMDENVWVKLNHDFHHFIENNKAPINQPPYMEQAMVLNIMNSHNIISLDNALDFAGGYGTLSRILDQYFKLNISIYDPYIQDTSSNLQYLNKNELGKYDLVFNSALFEHLFLRSDFDEINNHISDNGCLILHTVICENIPSDENWFYLEHPVHCAFHTNKSMQILMEQWGFISSIYSPQAKFWVLFKEEPKDLNVKISTINNIFQHEF